MKQILNYLIGIPLGIIAGLMALWFPILVVFDHSTTLYELSYEFVMFGFLIFGYTSVLVITGTLELINTLQVKQ